MQRRSFIRIAIFTSLSTQVFAKEKKIKFYKSFSQELNFPDVLKPTIHKNGLKEFNLNLKESQVSFLQNVKTKTYGINSSFLGPIIKVQRGDDIKINVLNSLKEKSVLHWHGLHLEGNCDGGPNRSIDPNSSWTTQFKINQRAATYWYHPHTHEKTGEQVFKGLAGLFIIEDKDSNKADLPKEYAVDDIPLIIQDRRFDNKAEFLYKYSMHDVMMGVKGNIFLVNGVIRPYINVSPKTIRFRILNGSNSRFYSFEFSDKRGFYQIAGDASFLEKPVEMKSLLLAPGQRAEVIVDLSDLKNKSIYFGDSYSDESLLKINVKDEKEQKFILPSNLTKIHEYTNIKDLSSLKRRVFTLNMSMGFLGINGRKMDMSYINEKVNLGETEIWVIKNPGRMPHPFHIHGCSFRILSRNKKQAYLNERALLDTVIVFGNEIVEVLVQFNYKASKEYPFMYHCHILEHEDAGMMGQFKVEDKTI